MSFLVELSDEIDRYKAWGIPIDIIILGKNRLDELFNSMTVIKRETENEKATKRPTFNGIPILVDYDCPNIVEFCQKV